MSLSGELNVAIAQARQFIGAFWAKRNAHTKPSIADRAQA